MLKYTQTGEGAAVQRMHAVCHPGRQVPPALIPATAIGTYEALTTKKERKNKEHSLQ